MERKKETHKWEAEESDNADKCNSLLYAHAPNHNRQFTHLNSQKAPWTFTASPQSLHEQELKSGAQSAQPK